MHVHHPICEVRHLGRLEAKLLNFIVLMPEINTSSSSRRAGLRIPLRSGRPQTQP